MAKHSISKADIPGRSGAVNAALKKRRGAFLTSFAAAFLLTLLVLTASLAVTIVDEKRFENALLTHVAYRELGTDEASVRSFADSTIRYLSGAQANWDPQIAIQGMPASAFIPQAFREHMATVRGWVVSARAVVAAAAVAVLGLLGRMLLGGRKSGRLAFSLAGYYLGLLLPLGVLGGVGVWAYLDFDGMWA